MDIRSRYLVVTIIAWVLFALVVYAQQIDLALLPTPLNILNSLCLAVMCLLLLAVTWFCPKKTGQYCYGSILIIVALMGLSVTAREFWLQAHVPASAYCFTSQTDIWNNLTGLPLPAFISEAWHYGTNCPDSYVNLWGLSLSPFFIFIYVLLIILVLWQLTHVSRFGAHGQVGQRLG